MEDLTINGNTLPELNLLNCPKLKTLSAPSCTINSIDFSNNQLLEYAYIPFNNISRLDFSNNLNLGTVNISGNPITESREALVECVNTLREYQPWEGPGWMTISTNIELNNFISPYLQARGWIAK